MSIASTVVANAACHTYARMVRGVRLVGLELVCMQMHPRQHGWVGVQSVIGGIKPKPMLCARGRPMPDLPTIEELERELRDMLCSQRRFGCGKPLHRDDCPAGQALAIARWAREKIEAAVAEERARVGAVLAAIEAGAAAIRTGETK